MVIFPKTKIEKHARYPLKTCQEIQAYYKTYADKMYKEKERFNHFKGFENRRIRSHLDHFSMSMRRNKLGLYVCDIQIQGRTLIFLVDTGAQISGILKQSSEGLKLETLEQEVQVGSIGGSSKQTTCVRVEKMFFGAVEIDYQPFVLLEDKDFSLPYVNIKLMRFDGILGWDILCHFDFEMDDKHQLLTILHTPIKPMIENFIPASFPCICLMDQNGVPIIFGFDSGAKESWLGKHYIEAAKLSVAATQKAYGMGVLGMESFELWVVDALDLYLYDYKIFLQKVMSGRVDMFQSVAIAGVLGNKIFRNHKIQIFTSKHYIRIV